ncbi:MAG: response regulator transcription factor [Arenimonas sp.]|nr:response regulator transcription factor [Arenimonas sp.]MBP6625801.1 response regulator transcription factor [Arenimonas sp.]
MAQEQATVFVIDDEPEVREGLARLLRSAGWQAACFASADDFLEYDASSAVGCILLDVNMPGCTGPELQEILRSRKLTLPVIFLTGKGTISTGVRAMKKGAFDFLEKPADEDVLLPAIESAVAVHRSCRRQAIALGDFDQRIARLSVRELQVMEHVMRGRLNKQIAAELAIAEKTVKVHRGRAMAKMRVRSVAELVHLYDQMHPERLEGDPT